MTFLPSIEILSSKIQLFDSARSGFRLTGLASIGLLPALAWYLRNSWKRTEVRDLVLTLAAFGMFANIFFFTVPHVAGRLARLSDFILLPLLGASLVLAKTGRLERMALLTPVIMCVPLVYPTLY